MRFLDFDSHDYQKKVSKTIAYFRTMAKLRIWEYWFTNMVKREDTNAEMQNLSHRLVRRVMGRKMR